MKQVLINNHTALYMKSLVKKARAARDNQRAVERQIAKLRDQIQLFADEYVAPGEPVLKEPPAKLTDSILQLQMRRKKFALEKRRELFKLEEIILEHVPDGFYLDDSEVFKED